jgi:hypothetical protein
MPDQLPPRSSQVSRNEGSKQAEEIIARVQRGDITPDDAEQLAKKHGLPPFAGRPPSSTFDPMSSPTWTPLQAIAWIAFRDVDEVRNASPEFRQHCYVWLPGPSSLTPSFLLLARNRGKKSVGWHMEQMGPPSFSSLADPGQRALEGLATHADKSLGDATTDKVNRAHDDLWAALVTGEIRATGFVGESRQRSVIRSIEWNDLTLDVDADDVVYGHRGLICERVRVNREAILRQWPNEPTLESVLRREAKSRKDGRLTQKDAIKIARHAGVYSTREDVRNALSRDELGGKQGRKKTR